MGTAIALEQREQAEAAQQLIGIVSGFWLSRAVQVAVTLGIPDLIAARPKTAAELAAETSTDTGSLYRLLRALASFAVLREEDGHRFAPTALCGLLRKQIPGSLRSVAQMELGLMHYQAWGSLIDSVRTGDPAFNQVFGMGPWEYLEGNPEMAAVFNDAMTNLTEAALSAIARVYDFTPYRKIVDIGGGRGRMLAGILAANAEARGVLFDRAPVVEDAHRALAGRPEAARIELAPGDFFDSVPEGGDLYTLKMILHDWADPEAEQILANVRRAMAPNARVLILEHVLPEANTPGFAALMDLNMLVMTGGRERRAAEFRALLSKAGLRLTEVYPTGSLVSIVEAVRA
ncbi:MAG: methyltransferase [Acidobacteriota bacterium]